MKINRFSFAILLISIILGIYFYQVNKLFNTSDLQRNHYMLKGPLAKKGYDW